MKRIFICFAPRDASFAGLLKRLLRFHNFDPYSDNAVELPDGIDDTWMDPAILHADLFLVVLSKRILCYDWARLELDTFLGKGSGKVICLALEDINPRHFLKSLDARTVIDFHTNLEAGFEILFSELGSVFLELGGKGAATDRRRNGDRRHSGTAARLREGFLKAYKQGGPQELEYSRMPRSVENRTLLYHGLMAEAKRYTYTNRVNGLPSEAEEALSHALKFVWEGRMSQDNIAVNLLEDIADAIEQNNLVEALQRRGV